MLFLLTNSLLLFLSSVDIEDNHKIAINDFCPFIKPNEKYEFGIFRNYETFDNKMELIFNTKGNTYELNLNPSLEEVKIGKPSNNLPNLLLNSLIIVGFHDKNIKTGHYMRGNCLIALNSLNFMFCHLITNGIPPINGFNILLPWNNSDTILFHSQTSHFKYVVLFNRRDKGLAFYNINKKYIECSKNMNLTVCDKDQRISDDKLPKVDFIYELKGLELIYKLVSILDFSEGSKSGYILFFNNEGHIQYCFQTGDMKKLSESCQSMSKWKTLFQSDCSDTSLSVWVIVVIMVLVFLLFIGLIFGLYVCRRHKPATIHGKTTSL